MGVYYFVSRTKTRDKIATIYNILIIYSSKKNTLGSVETKNIYKCMDDRLRNELMRYCLINDFYLTL